MQKRRVEFKLGVVYETPPKEIKKLPKMIEGVFKGLENVEFSRAHFKEFGDFSLNFVIVFFIEGSDYKRYMDLRQKINNRILDLFEKENISFAYPTQEVIIRR